MHPSERAQEPVLQPTERAQERVLQLWHRQQRADGAGADATVAERHYYKLIEQLETPVRVTDQVVATEGTGRYRFRLEQP